MAIPFPSLGFIPAFTAYPTPPFQDPALQTSAKSAWLQTPAPANAFYFDQNTLRAHVASGIAVTAGSPGPPVVPPKLTLTAEGATQTFDLSGDGTGRIPVGIVDP